MRAIVFANGEFSSPIPDLKIKQPDDILIAANGGSHHCQALGIVPDVLIGDLDSVDQGLVEAFKAAGCQVILYPRRKDFTDLELALQYAVGLQPEEILLLGALGKRWDQTIANLLLPGTRILSQAHIHLLDGHQEIMLVRAGEKLQLKGSPGDIVSLIPLSGDAHGVTTFDLEYPLNSETLTFGATRGVSNVLLINQGAVELKEGMLLCVLIHEPKTL